MLMKVWRENKLGLFSVLLACVGITFLVAALDFDGEDPRTDTGEQPKITFAVYGDKDIQKVVEDVAAVFMQQSSCKVEVYCYSTEEELKAKVVGQLAAGKAFDIFCTDVDTVSFLSSGDWLVNLDELVEQRRAQGDEFYQAALLCGEVMGEQYGIPTGVMPYMIYYNVDYFEKYGLDTPQQYFERKQWSFEDFRNCLTDLTACTSTPSFELDARWPVINAMLHCDGGDFQKEGETISLDRQACKTMDLLKELEEQHIIEYAGSIKDVRTPEERFAAGELPMTIGDLSMTRLLNGSGKFEWDVVPLPSLNSDFTNSVFHVPLIAACKGENVELAEEFIDFYVSTFGQKNRLEQGECLLPSLNMTFYTSMGDVTFPDHSNYYFYVLEKGYADYNKDISDVDRKTLTAFWDDGFQNGTESTDTAVMEE